MILEKLGWSMTNKTATSTTKATTEDRMIFVVPEKIEDWFLNGL